MSISQQIAICPHCGEPYYVYSMTVVDQSMCSACRNSLERRIKENQKSNLK